MDRRKLLSDRLAEIETEIDVVDTIREDAQTSDRPNLAAAATAASKWASLREKRHRVVVEIALLDESDPLNAVQAYRDAAFTEGAGGLSEMLRMEMDLMERRQKEEEERRRGLSANKIDALVEAIRRLPKPAQAQILAMLSAGDGVGAN